MTLDISAAADLLALHTNPILLVMATVSARRGDVDVLEIFNR